MAKKAIFTCNLGCTADFGRTPLAACNFVPNSFACSRSYCSRFASAVAHSFVYSPVAGYFGRIRCHFVAFVATIEKKNHKCRY